MNMLFRKKTPHARWTPPAGMGIDDVRTESSICTGEKTIGFFDRHRNLLLCPQLVRGEEDIVAFYHGYGWEPPPGGPRQAGPGQ